MGTETVVSHGCCADDGKLTLRQCNVCAGAVQHGVGPAKGHQHGAADHADASPSAGVHPSIWYTCRHPCYLSGGLSGPPLQARLQGLPDRDV